MGGDREDYRPLESSLCRRGDPFELIANYRTLTGCSLIYLADLDALLGGRRQEALLQKLQDDFPEIHFWVDCGWPPLGPERQITPVIGSEGLTLPYLERLKTLPKPWLLSLDFRHRFLGPPLLLQQTDLWPEGIILMRLDRVGRRRGPAFHHLAAWKRRFPTKKWIAAGGVRHRGDLARLKRIGIEAVLVSTALHHGLLP